MWEEVRARKEEAEDLTSEEQMSTGVRTNGRPTQEMPDTTDKEGTPEDRDNEHETKAVRAPSFDVATA